MCDAIFWRYARVVCKQKLGKWREHAADGKRLLVWLHIYCCVEDSGVLEID